MFSFRNHLLCNQIAISLGMSGLLIPVAMAQPTVSLVNQTRGGSSTFYDGDGYTVSIQNGATNASVSVTEYLNGSLQGTYPAGSTNGSGSLQINGWFTANLVGSWQEIWSVGGVQASPTLSFTVANLTSTQTLVPNTTAHPDYLFNTSYQ